MRYGLISAALTATLLGSVAANAADLVTNGSFSAGLTGFTTTYATMGSASNTYPGVIALLTGGDHTTGTGNYLSVDTNSSGGNDFASRSFWSETFGVVANSAYAFTAYVKQANGAPFPQFEALANGTSLTGVVSVANTDWTQVNGTYSSGTATSATLSLFNRDGSYIDNDLYVDDISFTGPATGAVPEPATWAMVLSGFAIVGSAARRRRAAVVA